MLECYFQPEEGTVMFMKKLNDQLESVIFRWVVLVVSVISVLGIIPTCIWRLLGPSWAVIKILKGTINAIGSSELSLSLYFIQPVSIVFTLWLLRYFRRIERAFLENEHWNQDIAWFMQHKFMKVRKLKWSPVSFFSQTNSTILTKSSAVPAIFMFADNFIKLWNYDSN